MTDAGGHAPLSLSRAPIPHVGRDGFHPGRWWKQVCVMAFRREPAPVRRPAPTPLEMAESIDMLRFLEHGLAVGIAPTDARTFAVDTPEDLVAWRPP
ncbi:MAG: hypothetical protein R2712_22875 [Vicinamibacterales bacterium]